MSATPPTRRVTRLFASAAFLCLPAVGSAVAQDQPSAPPGNGALEEIAVVAQKRSENIQKAAQAITAITGAGLDQANVVNPVDLNGQVPSLVITQSEGFNNS